MRNSWGGEGSYWESRGTAEDCDPFSGQKLLHNCHRVHWCVVVQEKKALIFHISELMYAIRLHKRSNTSRQNWAFTVSPEGTNSWCTSPLQSKKEWALSWFSIFGSKVLPLSKNFPHPKMHSGAWFLDHMQNTNSRNHRIQKFLIIFYHFQLAVCMCNSLVTLFDGQCMGHKPWTNLPFLQIIV